MKREEIYFLSIVAISVFLAAECLFAQADELWLPRARHYEAMERGTECAILRNLAREAQNRLNGTLKQLIDQKNTLQTKRQQLETCAEEKGVLASTAAEWNETRLAERCPAAYESWVTPGFRYRMLAQDLNEVQLTLQAAQSHLTHHCL
jgi:hypothetical protein